MGGQTFAAGSTIADQVLVVFEHAYSGGPGAPPTGLERKDPGGSWTDTGATVTTFSQGEVTYTRATYTWGPNDWKNQTVEFRGKYKAWITSPPPPRWSDWSYSSSSSWTRQDMVVSNDNGVLLFDGSTAVSIPWTITHANDGSNPTFEVTITIYGVTGSTVRVADTTDDAALGSKSAGAGSWSWNGRNDDNQVVAAGVYPYKVRAVHQAYWQNCHDTDKSYRMTPLALSITNLQQGFDVPTLTLTLTANYSVTGKDATDAKLAVYDPELNQIAYGMLGPSGNGSVSAGYSGQKVFNLELDPDQMGVFSVVMFARETSAGGAANRDGAQKYGLQYVRTATLWPTARNFYTGPSLQDPWGRARQAAEVAQVQQSLCEADGTRYDSSREDGTAASFMEWARKSSLLRTVGHGDSVSVWVGSGGAGRVTMEDICDPPPDGLRDLPVLLSLHLNCFSADFAAAMVETCGADCAIGWGTDTSIPVFSTPVFSNYFWDELCDNNNTLGGAALVAADWAYATSLDASWYDYEIFGGVGGVCPARYGE